RRALQRIAGHARPRVRGAGEAPARGQWECGQSSRRGVMIVAMIARPFQRNGISAADRLGLLPLPLAGEGWGGGKWKYPTISHAPSLSLPRKRGRGPCGAVPETESV